MDRRDALVLLGVCAVAVFLSGLELMVTAVALPAIVCAWLGWRLSRPRVDTSAGSMHIDINLR